MNTGIDYGLGQTNIDKETGIRYGVIHKNEVGEAWFESAEADYGKPHCPDCGDQIIETSELSTDLNEAIWNTGRDYACRNCEACFWSEECFPEEALAYLFDDGEYKAEQNGGDCDIFVTKSPYYTLAQFCSPCAPGAGYLMNEGTVKSYCFGHDWFEGGKAPYKVYRVADDTVVEPEQA